MEDILISRNAESFVTYLATSTLDLVNMDDYNPDRLTLGVSVRDLLIKFFGEIVVP